MKHVAVMAASLWLPQSAGATVLCRGGEGQAPRWVNDIRECDAGPSARARDPREREAERRALSARKISDQLAKDRERASGLDPSLAYALPAGLAALAAGLAAQGQSASQPPPIPKTTAELAGQPNPAESWKAYSTRLSEAVVAMKLQNVRARPGGPSYDITPKSASAKLSAPAGAPTLSGRFEPRAVEGERGPRNEPRSQGGPGAVARAAYPSRSEASGGAHSSSISAGGTPGASGEKKGGESGQPALALGTMESRTGSAKDAPRLEFSKLPALADTKKNPKGDPKEALSADAMNAPAPAALDLFERALDKAAGLGSAQTATSKQANEATLFTVVSAQYRKREALLVAY